MFATWMLNIATDYMSEAIVMSLYDIIDFNQLLPFSEMEMVKKELCDNLKALI